MSTHQFADCKYDSAFLVLVIQQLPTTYSYTQGLGVAYRCFILYAFLTCTVLCFLDSWQILWVPSSYAPISTCSIDFLFCILTVPLSPFFLSRSVQTSCRSIADLSRPRFSRYYEALVIWGPATPRYRSNSFGPFCGPRSPAPQSSAQRWKAVHLIQTGPCFSKCFPEWGRPHAHLSLLLACLHKIDIRCPIPGLGLLYSLSLLGYCWSRPTQGLAQEITLFYAQYLSTFPEPHPQSPTGLKNSNKFDGLDLLRVPPNLLPLLLAKQRAVVFTRALRELFQGELSRIYSGPRMLVGRISSQMYAPHREA